MNDGLDYPVYENFKNIVSEIDVVQNYASTAGVIMNIPHIFILTRSSMRTSSTNSLMIGIAICDILYLSILAELWIRNAYFSDFLCINVGSYAYIVSAWILECLRDLIEKASFWLGFMLAMTRYIIMKSSGRADKLARPSSGYLITFIISVISAALSGWYYGRYYLEKDQNLWIMWDECAGYRPKVKGIRYFLVMDDAAIHSRSHTIINAISRTLISFLYPIIGVLLMVEIRRSAKFAAKKLKSEKSATERYHASRMILVMTVMYFLASAPIGALDFINVSEIVTESSFLRLSLDHSAYLMSAIFCLNSASHCIINLSMSSAYRNTIKMSWMRSPKSVKIFTVTRIKSIG